MKPKTFTLLNMKLCFIILENLFFAAALCWRCFFTFRQQFVSLTSSR